MRQNEKGVIEKANARHLIQTHSPLHIIRTELISMCNPRICNVYVRTLPICVLVNRH